ncbi:MAG: hypothetical protein ABJJ05_08785 [Maribacter litoralis]|uniref:hypothetical protein n=1 Tax=Maribacter litoralis TaxID=2059726 RepID=UPI0032969487
MGRCTANTDQCILANENTGIDLSKQGEIISAVKNGLLVERQKQGARFIDEVILPKDTRRKLIKAYTLLENKVATLPKKKHGNIPL